MNKDTQAAILRAAGRFISKRLEALEPRFKALETRAMTPGPSGEKGDPGESGSAGENGRDGIDGKSVTLEEVLPAILPEVRKAIAEIPLPENGKDGRDGEPGSDGKSVTIDELAPLIEAKAAQWQLEFERRASDVLQKAIDKMPIPKDGRDGIDGAPGVGWDDMTVEHDGKRGISLKWMKGDVQHIAEIRIPCVIDAGFYKEGQTYEQGDGVTFGGSYWIAQKDTSSKPEVGSDEWRLGVRRGRDGKSAERAETRPVIPVAR